MTAVELPATEAVDAALADLERGEKLWAALPLSRRRELLEEIHDLTGAHAEEWVAAARTVKNLEPSSPYVGEEYMSGPYAILASTASLAQSIGALERGLSPLHDAKLSSARGGRVAVQVLPVTPFDTVLFSGFQAEVWLQPGVDRTTTIESAGLAQLTPDKTNGIGVVLGAGNIMSIAPLDVLYELFANNRVAALKLNPVTDAMLPVFTKIFRPLIDMGAVRILTGGTDVGSYLVNHEKVSHVHITGSSLSHDAIVFGAGDDGARRKAANEPIMTKPITSELGGVSPTIVFPGEWTDADLRFQAEHVVTQRLHNNGYNCIAAQAVIVSSSWPQKDAFIAQIRNVMDRVPARKAYYPGSDDRVASAVEAHPRCERLGRGRERVLVPGIKPTDNDPLLRTEYFSPVLGIVELSGVDDEFAAQAVDFANEQCAGTLGVNVIVAPATVKRMGAAFDAAIERLRYGTVAINAWTGLGYLASRATWGAFPGHTLDDVQSGIGVVHNAYLLDHVERTVVRGPFRPAPRAIVRGELSLTPRPPWFVTNKTATVTGRRLVKFATRPRWTALPGIFSSALRG